MKQIFINLPVADLTKSSNFDTQLGFSVEPLFTDKDQKCMVWSNHIYVMLQSKIFFYSYLKIPVLNTIDKISSTYTLPVESIDKVNKIIEKGILAGGKEPVPMIKEEFMLLRSIEDLDGHIWEIIYLDMDKFRALKDKESIGLKN